jgi:hypothetical protein
MFKTAIAKFDSNDVTVFQEAVVCYKNYSDVLIGYKNTKFIISLYGEIKSYIARIKQLITKRLDLVVQQSRDPLVTEITRNQVYLVGQNCLEYLSIFGEDKTTLKLQMVKIQTNLYQTYPLTNVKTDFIGKCVESF